jgi:DNA-binding transcriptional LysR family regulator
MVDLEPRLLRAFLAIYVTRSVTGAARQQGVSQPTMSEHLRRLRVHFGDRLFVPGSSGMRPTDRAEEIHPVAERVVADLEALASKEVLWDCRSAQRRFHILASVYTQTLLLPELDRRLREEAPGVRLHVEPAGAGSDPDAVDVAIWPINVAPPHHRMRALFTDRLVCVFHPAVAVSGPPLDLKTFCGLEHVLFAPAPSPLHDAVDHALAKLGLRRQVCSIIGQTAGLPQLLKDARRLAILPKRLVATAAPGLACAPIPVEVEPIRMVMSWPLRRDRDQGNRWLRAAVAATAAWVTRDEPLRGGAI